jgi:hypothetical protein
MVSDGIKIANYDGKKAFCISCPQRGQDLLEESEDRPLQTSLEEEGGQEIQNENLDHQVFEVFPI